MSYLDRPVPPKGPPWAHNSLGASVHNALAGWWRLPLPRRTVQAAGALVTQGWIGEGFAGDAQSARYRDWARTLVEAYVSGLDPADEPVGVERTVATGPTRSRYRGGSTGSTPARGRTGRTAPSLSWSTTRPAATCCRWTTRAARSRWRSTRSPPPGHCAATAAGWNCTTCRPGRCSPGSTPRSRCSGTCGRAEDIAAECADADERMRAPLPREKYDEVFPPRTGPGCGWCDYLRSCPEGQAAAAAHRPWDALAELP